MSTAIDDSTIEGLLDEWRDEAGGHSFDHTMQRGPAFDDLMASAERLVPFLLRRVRDDGPWMGYQGLLRRLTGADIWHGEWVTPGMRAYDVKASGLAWLAWGQHHNLIDW